MCRAAGLSSEPILEATPPKLTLGPLPSGAQRQKTVDYRVINARHAWGSVRLDPVVPGCTITSSFEGMRGRLTLDVDLLDVVAGSYTTTIVMSPETLRTPFRIPLVFDVLPVTLAVMPSSVKLGPLTFGAQVITPLEWSTTPSGGRIAGTATLARELAGTTISGDVDGGFGRLQLAIDTQSLRAGERYEQIVRVQAGDQTLDVPVTFEIPLDHQLVARWTVGMAVFLAVVLGFLRQWLVEINPVFSDWVGRLPGTSASYLGGAALCLALLLVWKGISVLSRRRTTPALPSNPDASVGAG